MKEAEKKQRGVLGGRTTECQGPRHPGPESTEHQKQGGARKKANKGGTSGSTTRREGPRHPGPEYRERCRQRGRNKEKKQEEHPTTTTNRATPARRGPNKQRAHQDGPQKKVRRTKTRPGGRLAGPGQEGRAHAHTHGTRVWRPPTRKRRCWRPYETAPVHRPTPLSEEGRYRKPDASVTWSTHANHRSARSPRPTQEGPARDNPIAGPRMGMMRSGPGAPASAGASGRHKEPGSRLASTCPAQPPSKSGDASEAVPRTP